MGSKKQVLKQKNGHKVDNCLAIRPENGSRHTNFFVRIQPKTLEIQIVEDLSRSKPRDAPPKNLRFLENQEEVSILLHPEMGQKARFGNEHGHEMDKVLAI